MKEPEIVSVVGGGDLGREFDLETLSEAIEGNQVSFDPDIFPGLKIRFETNGPSILLFRSGKYNIAGASSTSELYDAREMFLSEIEGLGIDGLNPTFKVHNYVIKTDLDRKIDLEKVSITLGLENTEYEPEQFPGLLYRPPDSDLLFLIFSTGSVVLTGIQEPDKVEVRFLELDSQLREYSVNQ